MSVARSQSSGNIFNKLTLSLNNSSKFAQSYISFTFTKYLVSLFVESVNVTQSQGLIFPKYLSFSSGFIALVSIVFKPSKIFFIFDSFLKFKFIILFKSFSSI
jgi:hypothetical protein